MPRYRLILAGVPTARAQIADAAPELAPAKGFWARETDSPPSFNPATQTRTGPTWTVTDPAGDEEGTVVAAYVVASRPLADVKADRLAELAAYRYGNETGGVTVSGMTVATDDRSKALIVGAYSAAKAGVTDSFKWKMEGGFVALNAAQVIGVGEAVFAFVQGCFAAEATHAASIAALNAAADVVAYDFTAGWPS